MEKDPLSWWQQSKFCFLAYYHLSICGLHFLQLPYSQPHQDYEPLAGGALLREHHHAGSQFHLEITWPTRNRGNRDWQDKKWRAIKWNSKQWNGQKWNSKHHHNVSIDILQPICEDLYPLLVHLFCKKRCKENQSLVCKCLLLLLQLVNTLVTPLTCLCSTVNQPSPPIQYTQLFNKE